MTAEEWAESFLKGGTWSDAKQVLTAYFKIAMAEASFDQAAKKLEVLSHSKHKGKH